MEQVRGDRRHTHGYRARIRYARRGNYISRISPLNGGASERYNKVISAERERERKERVTRLENGMGWVMV